MTKGVIIIVYNKSKNNRIFSRCLNYVEFLNNKTYADWMKLSENNSINCTRVKQINSIYYKTVKYAQNKVNGEVTEYKNGY